jgi:hypothetical protein
LLLKDALNDWNDGFDINKASSARLGNLDVVLFIAGSSKKLAEVEDFDIPLRPSLFLLDPFIILTLQQI